MHVVAVTCSPVSRVRRQRRLEESGEPIHLRLESRNDSGLCLHCVPEPVEGVPRPRAVARARSSLYVLIKSVGKCESAS